MESPLRTRAEIMDETASHILQRASRLSHLSTLDKFLGGVEISIPKDNELIFNSPVDIIFSYLISINGKKERIAYALHTYNDDPNEEEKCHRFVFWLDTQGNFKDKFDFIRIRAQNRNGHVEDVEFEDISHDKNLSGNGSTIDDSYSYSHSTKVYQYRIPQIL
jgi:hypothetical protein